MSTTATPKRSFFSRLRGDRPAGAPRVARIAGSPDVGPLAGTWTVDPSHSTVEFAVKHLGISTVKGTFGAFEGTLEVGGDLDSAVARGSVDAASIDTKESARDEHLRSADFFDVENAPKLTFASTAIRPVDEETFEIEGDLTMRGQTNAIALRATIEGYEEDPYGNQRVALNVTGVLDRGEYGMTFNQVLGSGNMLVSDRVKLNLDISAVRAA